MKSNKKFGFTLVEVLIVIGVIGIVAVMTIPNLITKYEKKVTVEKLKVAYSLLSQVVNKARAEHGDIVTWDFDLDEKSFAERYILPYLTGLQPTSNYNLNTLAGSYYLFWSGYKGIDRPYVLSNGMILRVSKYVTYNNLAYLMIDLNGKKLPNLISKDGFVFVVDKEKNRLYPFGEGKNRNSLMNDSNSACKKTGFGNRHYGGANCASLIIMDGWKIKDDYPW